MFIWWHWYNFQSLGFLMSEKYHRKVFLFLECIPQWQIGGKEQLTEWSKGNTTLAVDNISSPNIFIRVSFFNIIFIIRPNLCKSPNNRPQSDHIFHVYYVYVISNLKKKLFFRDHIEHVLHLVPPPKWRSHWLQTKVYSGNRKMSLVIWARYVCSLCKFRFSHQPWPTSHHQFPSL